MTVAQKKTEFVPREKRFFSLAEANRALPLVRRIVRDIIATYRQVLAVRTEADAYRATGRQRDFDKAQDDLYELVAELQSFLGELADIGVQLKDWNAGLVDFPAVHQGREVLLCWQPGEESIQFWHEHYDGAAGRQPVATLDRRCRDET